MISQSLLTFAGAIASIVSVLLTISIFWVQRKQIRNQQKQLKELSNISEKLHSNIAISRNYEQFFGFKTWVIKNACAYFLLHLQLTTYGPLLILVNKKLSMSS